MKLFEQTLNVVYVVSQVSLITFAIYMSVINM